MRLYDDPVEVRRSEQGDGSEPDQFIWRGRLWQVREVASHWIETRLWWLGNPSEVRADEVAVTTDLLSGHEIWRVTAVAPGLRPRAAQTTDPHNATGLGVFYLALILAEGNWKLTRADY